MHADTRGGREGAGADTVLVQSIVFAVPAGKYRVFRERLWRVVDELRSLDAVREVRVFAPPMAGGEGRVNVIVMVFWEPSGFWGKNEGVRRVQELVESLRGVDEDVVFREEVYSLPVGLQRVGGLLERTRH